MLLAKLSTTQTFNQSAFDNLRRRYPFRRLFKPLSIMNELEALQNAANRCGLVIHEWHHLDRRKKIKHYYATKDGTSISPSLGYEQLNYFLLGYIKATKTL